MQGQGNKVEEGTARLILEDGSEFQGRSIGYPSPVSGEVVFSTGMTGYPEAFTDPSYQGQILALTYPLIGNYGMPPWSISNNLADNYESHSAWISGLLVADYSTNYSHWNSETSLSQWLYNQKIPGIGGIDTRSLTKRLRENGTMLGKILAGDGDVGFYDPNSHNLAEQVSIDRPRIFGAGKKRVLLIDCGCKHSIIRNLLKRNVQVVLVPWDYPVLEEECDGVLISSGPGDPRKCAATIREAQNALKRNLPTFGICLGHQILSLAMGADTTKMKYGHRSQNQPVEDQQTGRCYITTQNHGFIVDSSHLPEDWEPFFVNLNDGSNEGIIHRSGRFFGVQFHPEASPGPTDTEFLFDQFVESLQ